MAISFREHLTRKRKRFCLIIITSTIIGTITGIIFDSPLVACIVTSSIVLISVRIYRSD